MSSDSDSEWEFEGFTSLSEAMRGDVEADCGCRSRREGRGTGHSESITNHCDAHCPRVQAGDWQSCRGC